MSTNSEDCSYEIINFDIIQFLDEYEKFPCLWDSRHVQFKDRKERLRCEEILGQKLGIHDLRTLRRKIRSVRGTYNTEIRKIKQCIESGSEVSSKLFWFPRADKFLRITTDLRYEVFPPLVTKYSKYKTKLKNKQLLRKLPGKNGVNILLVSPTRQGIKEEHHEDFSTSLQEEEETNFENSINSYEEYENIETLEEEDQNSSDISLHFESLDDFDRTEHTVDTSSVSKLKTHKKQNDGINQVVDYLKDVASENEFIAFGRSVGMQLRNMPLELAVKLQMDIQSHITKTRLKYLQQTENNVEST